METRTLAMPRSLFVFSLLYGGLAVLAGVLGTKLASLGHWPVLGDLAVESGIFAFLLLVKQQKSRPFVVGPRMSIEL